MNKKIATLVTSALLTAPLMVLADIPSPAVPTSDANLNVIGIINKILNFIWPVFIGFAVIMFLVAGFYFLTAQGDAGKVAQARLSILWGIVGIAVGVLAFSIPYVVLNAI